MSPRGAERLRQALLGGLVCLSVGLGLWIAWVEMPLAQQAYEEVLQGPLIITDMPVRWFGHPVVGAVLEGGRYESQKLLPEYDIGLRADGVVVWRKNEGANP